MNIILFFQFCKYKKTYVGKCYIECDRAIPNVTCRLCFIDTENHWKNTDQECGKHGKLHVI